MSDRHVGLHAMVRDHFPMAEHWMCCEHLLRSAPAVGAVGLGPFWRAAKATHVLKFKQAMAELRLLVSFAPMDLCR